MKYAAAALFLVAAKLLENVILEAIGANAAEGGEPPPPARAQAARAGPSMAPTAGSAHLNIQITIPRNFTEGQ